MKRDPDKTARNRIIAKIKNELKSILDDVLSEVNLKSEQSLNAKIGSKNDDFFDLKNDIIRSHDEFICKWIGELKKFENSRLSYGKQWLISHLNNSPLFKKYLLLFLKRSYLLHYEELSKKRPTVDNAGIWIGQSNANYGLLVTPRFANGKWENDRSEIRAFKEGYWTIGHVLTTGLVVPDKESKFSFKSVDEYLNFFLNVIVRNSGSQYEYAIAEEYCNYVKSATKPNEIPILIPEFRYLGIEKAHKYRLDFVIINPYTLDKIGFELSPWSTHGYLSKTKNLTQAKINEMAKDNFEKEMRKHRDFFLLHNIYVLIFTDEMLSDCKKLFADYIIPLLEPEKPDNGISFQIMSQYL